jgi:hypothetical protein
LPYFYLNKLFIDLSIFIINTHPIIHNHENKITEEQANRLSLLNNNNPIVNVERFSKIKTEIVNRLFSEVLNLTIGESLSGFDKLELIQENVIIFLTI